MEIDRGAGGLVQRPDAADVVKMAVGQQDIPEGQAQIFKRLRHLAPAVSGIDDGAGSGLLIRHNVTVGLQRPQGQNRNLHQIASVSA